MWNWCLASKIPRSGSKSGSEHGTSNPSGMLRIPLLRFKSHACVWVNYNSFHSFSIISLVWITGVSINFHSHSVSFISLSLYISVFTLPLPVSTYYNSPSVLPFLSDIVYFSVSKIASYYISCSQFLIC